MTDVPPTTTAASNSVRLPPIHLLPGDDSPAIALPHTRHSSLFHHNHHSHHQQDRYQSQAQHPPPRQLMSASPLPPSFNNSRMTSSTQATPSSSSTAGITALALAAKHEDEISLSLSDEDMLLCDEADDDDSWSDAAPSSIEGAASSVEVRNKRGSAASSRGGGGGGAAEGFSNGKRNSNNRSRRLLSLEQSKVLYKILDKVWFQNRRQVGKKRMMESVQSLLSTYPPSASTPLSLDHIQDQLRSTGKTRFSVNEDERTRAWRRHTIRLALNPSAQEEEESKAAIRELERGGSAREYCEMHQGGERDRGYGERDSYASAAAAAVRVYPSHGFAWNMELEERESRIRASRSAASLRINVPRLRSHSSTSDSHTPATASTPTYTGPGSATHLETISSARTHSPLPPPLTAPSVRTIIAPPAIVTSQKESFSLPPHARIDPNFYRPYQRPSLPPPAVHQGFAPQGGGRRDRSATLSSVRWEEPDLRQVRNSLTAEWRYAQQRLLHHQAVDSRRVSPPNGRYSPYHVEGRRGRSESTPVDPGERREREEGFASIVATRAASPLHPASPHPRAFDPVHHDRPQTRHTSPTDHTKPTHHHHPDTLAEQKEQRNTRMDVRSLTTSNITNTRGGR